MNEAQLSTARAENERLKRKWAAEDKPTLLNRIKGGIRAKATELVTTRNENRQVYKQARRGAELSAIRARARADVGEKHGVSFGKRGATVIPGKRVGLTEKLLGSPDERAARYKRLYG